MDDNKPILTLFVDDSGESYYQQSQVCNFLEMSYAVLKSRYPNIFRRQAYPEELSKLRSLGIKIRRYGVTLLKMNDVKDIIERETVAKSSRRSKRSRSTKVKSRFSRANRSMPNNSTPVPDCRNPNSKTESYTKMVGHALLSAPDLGLTAAETIEWILNNYPHYRSQVSACTTKVINALTKTKYYVKVQPDSDRWRLDDEYIPIFKKTLRKSPTIVKKETSDIDQEDAAVAPSETEIIFIDETAVSTPSNSFVDEVNALRSSNETIGSNSNEGTQIVKIETVDIKTERETPPPVATPINTSTSDKMKSEVLDNINLVNDDVDNAGNGTGLQIRIDSVVSRTVNTVNTVNTASTVNSTLGESDLQCPICDAYFRTTAALGEHVRVHRGPNRNASESRQEYATNFLSTILGNNTRGIVVFVGDVYFNHNTTSTPLTEQ